MLHGNCSKKVWNFSAIMVFFITFDWAHFILSRMVDMIFEILFENFQGSDSRIHHVQISALDLNLMYMINSMVHLFRLLFKTTYKIESTWIKYDFKITKNIAWYQDKSKNDLELLLHSKTKCAFAKYIFICNFWQK